MQKKYIWHSFSCWAFSLLRFSKIKLIYLYNLCKYFYNNGVILTLQGSILYPQSSSILKYNPRHLDLVMHLVLKSYSRCSTGVVHSEPKISNTYGPHFVLLCKFTKATCQSRWYHLWNFSVMPTILAKFQCCSTCKAWDINSCPHFMPVV